MAYFDNAATTYPKPDVVYSYMDSFYRESGGSAGRGDNIFSRTSAELIKDTRIKMQKLLHCETKDIIFTHTATIALNMIVQGLIKYGCKNIYISPFEHNAITRNLYAMNKTYDLKIVELAVTSDYVYDLELIKYQFEDVRPDVIICTHASNVTGLVAPVIDIFNLGKKYNAFSLVDMSQTAGLVDINIGLDIIDFAVFAGHKTLYGPTGISGFAMKKGIDLPAVLYGGTGYDSANQDMPESVPEKYEMGTINILGIAGLNAAITWIEEVGINNIRKKEEDNRNRLLEIISGYSFIHTVGINEKQEYVGVVSCLIDDIGSDSASSIFNEKGISVRTGLQCAPLAHKFLHTYPAGTIRFSVSYFTTDEDFNDLIKAFDYIEENI